MTEEIKDIAQPEKEVKTLDKSFFKQDFKYRTSEVLLSSLGENNETVKVIVRQLTSIEVASIEDRISNDFGEAVKDVVKGIGGNGEEIIDAIQIMIDGTKGKPQTYIRKQYYLFYGMVEPKMDKLPDVAKFCEFFPVDSGKVSSKIAEMTNRGAVLANMTPQSAKKKQKKITSISK